MGRPKGSKNKPKTEGRKSSTRQTLEEPVVSDEIVVIVTFAVSIFLFLSNLNLCGPVGAFLKSVQLGLFGVLGFIFPLVLAFVVVFVLANIDNPYVTRRMTAAVFMMIFLAAIISLAGTVNPAGESLADLYRTGAEEGKGGGLIGGALGMLLYSFAGKVGAIILLVALILICLVYVTEKPLTRKLAEWGFRFAGRARTSARDNLEHLQESAREHRERRAEIEAEERAKWEAGEKERAARAAMHTPVLDHAASAGDASVVDLSGELRNQSTEINKTIPPEASPSFSFLSGAVQSAKNGMVKDDREIELPLNVRHERTDRKEPAAAGPVIGAQTLPTDVAASTSDVADTLAPDEKPADEGAGYSALNRAVYSGMKEAEISTGDDEVTTDDFPIHGLEKPASYTTTSRDTGSTIIRIRKIDPDAADTTMKEQKLSDETADASNQSEFTKILHDTADKPVVTAVEDEEEEENSGIIQIRALTSEEVSGAAASFQFKDDPDVDLTAGTRRIVTANGMVIDSDVERIDKKPVAASTFASTKVGNDQNLGMTEGTNQTVAIDSTTGGRAGVAAGAIGQSGAGALPGYDPRSEIKRENTPTDLDNQKTQQEILHNQKPKRPYQIPPLSLLKTGGVQDTDSEAEIRENANILQDTLKSFGVGVHVTNVSVGPAVTRYELQPEIGVKVSKIVSLTNDIKMRLAASDIRIEAPIPGKSAVGIEVPNKHGATVYLGDILRSKEFRDSRAKIAFGVGKDIAGKIIVSDISKMPHLLIAGATGSGKSVSINTLIMSILYKYKPEEVRMIMVDPKVVELSVYNGIPHLLIPVVTDPKKAAAALNWAVSEMTDRYKKFAETGARDLKGYNEKIEIVRNQPDIPEDKKPEKLPQIVIIIDELADLMMVASQEVEDAICRIAQLARAAGMHLVIATQRPTVDVITGLIKANVPSRIAFAVSSGTDSRTIIDMNGAEKLLGKGDMLFFPQGIPKPVRVQGAFVSDQEVQAVVDFIKDSADAVYSTDIASKVNDSTGGGAGGNSGSDRDELFEEAGELIITSQKASIGMLQRKFRIGFNRAARIMDQLAESGVVSEEEGTKPRKILMNQAEFAAFLSGNQ